MTLCINSLLIFTMNALHYFPYFNAAQLQIAVQYFLIEYKIFDCLCLKLQDSLLMSNCHLEARLSSTQRP